MALPVLQAPLQRKRVRQPLQTTQVLWLAGQLGGLVAPLGPYALTGRAAAPNPHLATGGEMQDVDADTR